MDRYKEKAIFRKISKGNEKAFEELFNTYYQPLCYYAIQFLEDAEDAEEVAQDIFVKLWEKRASIQIETSLKNYLFRSVRNQCLNQIQHNKVKQQHSASVKAKINNIADESDFFIEPGLASAIEKAIASMPEKRQEIFRLSREDGLKYKEIAEKLNISVKTVEAQMGLALKHLRKQLGIFNHESKYFQIFLFTL